MSPIRITARRTMGYARNAYTTAFVIGAFLAAGATSFAFALNSAEGGLLSAPVVWVSSIAPILPLLAAFLGMDAWSEERRTGRLEMLLTLPIPELNFTVGKFFGVWFLTLLSTGLSLAASVALLHIYAPACKLAWIPLVMAFSTLALQGALWSAVSVAASAIFPRAAIAACATSVLLVALPRGVWFALMAWSTEGHAAYGEMPLDAQAIDLTSGIISSASVLSYLILTALAIFIATVCVEMRRLIGRGARVSRATARTAMLLASVFSALLVLLVVRLDVTFELPASGKQHYSERTLRIIAESHGDIVATCFLPRSDSRFRATSRTLRMLARTAALRGGPRFTVRFVDPSWDLGEAARLVRKGVKPGNVFFSYGRRTAILPVDDGLGERLIASTILRLTTPPQRRNVHWTVGHGETAFDDYSPFGMSNIARELSRDGYVNQTIDLATSEQIPSDCALIVIAGARDEFSRTEKARLDAYLKQGGRLLVMMNSEEAGGISSVLARWGLNVIPASGTMRTVSGSDAIISDFSSHPVSEPLKGMTLLLEKPIMFAPSAAVEATVTADHIRFIALAKSGMDRVAALVERGGETGNDLGFRPTRIIAIGDSAFVMNAQLEAQGNANRDFFLNSIAYLSGTDAMTASGEDADRLTTGMDRAARRRFLLAGALIVPLVTMLILLAAAFRRRLRK